MLRFLTSGESHGQALVTILEGLPAGLDDRFRRHHARVAPPAGRLWPRPSHGDRVGSRRNPLRGPARPDDGCTGSPPRSQQGLGELAEHDARGSAGARRFDRREPRGGGPATARSRGPRRRAQIRSRRHPGRAGARERARDGGTRGGRRHCAAAAAGRWLRDHEPHHRNRPRGVAARRRRDIRSGAGPRA